MEHQVFPQREAQPARTMATGDAREVCRYTPPNGAQAAQRKDFFAVP